MSAESPEEIIKQTSERMDKAIEVLKREYGTVRTGRASATILDVVKVEYYGSQMPINQVAGIAIPDAHTLEVKPWDAGVLGEIEKAISKANLGINPNNDGQMIRLNFPTLTEERRKELVKQVYKMAEDMRIEIRNHRRKGIDGIKQLKKDKLISEDDERNEETKIQKLTDEYIEKIDHVTKTKEKELMEV